MYYLYILQSEDLKHFYIGTSQDPIKRLRKHNNGSSLSTKPYRPWLIIHTEKFIDKSTAMKREYFLKSAAGFLEKKRIFNQYKR